MTRLGATILLLACVGVTSAAGPPDSATWARFGEIAEVERLYARGIALYQAGKLPEATKALAEVVQVVEGLYPKARYPQGHTDLAQSLNDLAFLHQARGDHAKAGPLYVRALEMREALYPRDRYLRGHVDVAESLNNLAFLHQARGDYAKAEPLYVRALEMREALYPRDRYPQGHPDVANSLNNLAGLRYSLGNDAKAELLFRRALAMYEALYPRAVHPRGHRDLAQSLNNLAFLHQARGDYAKAEPLYVRALEMREALYPRDRYPLGHPHLAESLNNLAFLHQARGDHARAEPLYVRALEMREALYPKAGHPELAASLNNLAGLHYSLGNDAKAELLFRRALAMYEALYPTKVHPRGHRDLAQSLNNLAFLHQARGDYAKAEPLYARAVEMNEGLYPRDRYPQGHPHLASTLNNLALLQYSQGDYGKAELLFRRALQMYSDSATSLAASAPEATALNYIASQPLTRDGYLSTTKNLPEADAYPSVWQTKAALARVAERRHLAVLAASSKDSRVLWDDVVSLKRQREALLLAPADAARAKARDKQLDEIDEEIRKKEADLLPLLPAMKRSDDLARSTPADLCKALPADVAFIDLVRYVRFTQDPKVKGKKGERRTPHYVAFVVTRVGVTRVELGQAEPIEEAFGLWRRALVEGSESEPKYAAAVHGLIWSPLVKHLPAKASAVFVSPDAALNLLPWAALRDAKTNRVLIEEYAVAVMPHGPMLLDRLTEPKRKGGTGTLLAMGGVVYDKEPKTSSELALQRGPVGDAVLWQALAGTAKELTQVVELAGKRRVILREGTGAGAATLLADLPLAETAHLATHGFFADAKFRTAMQFDERLFGRMGNERDTAGSRSPLVLSGVVCSGANLPGTPNRGVLTAEAIVGLDLRKMNLAVLSACETGLGDVAGGEGVYGLARAFHVAGTRNVVASLWKVDDEATAALMVLFYRNLWGKEKVSPMEAMRRAQLALYRDPGKIKEWSQGRGPNLKVVIDGGKAPALTKGATTAPARAWAAFVLSGPGD